MSLVHILQKTLQKLHKDLLSHTFQDPTFSGINITSLYGHHVNTNDGRKLRSTIVEVASNDIMFIWRF